ncbi:hypothetical protein ACFQ3K_16730, partial [Brucella gallinifaecis]|uniref:hypothetical protein n=1 Tax=Brucella gallinifaecis TaxID=215590 RepID=UPI0036268E0C
QDDTFGKLRPFEIDHYPAPLIINQTYQTSTKSVKLKNFATEPRSLPDLFGGNLFQDFLGQRGEGAARPTAAFEQVKGSCRERNGRFGLSG